MQAPLLLLQLLMHANHAYHRDGHQQSFRQKFTTDYFEDGCDLRLFEEDTCKKEWLQMRREVKRNAIRCPRWLWPRRTIPYKVELKNATIVEKFQQAVQELNALGCVHFRQVDHRRNGQLKDPSVRQLEVREVEPAPGRSCQASLGTTARRPRLDLSHVCTKGQILHELMHVLGFAHEHQRPDRDSYVKVRCEHLMPNVTQDFRRLTEVVVDYDDEYDLMSIMHYRLDHFSVDGKRTLELVNPQYVRAMGINESDIGAMRRLSERDVRRIRRLYQC